MSKVIVKNIIDAGVLIGGFKKRVLPGEKWEIPGVKSVEEARKIPSVNLHVIRGRLEIFASTPEPEIAPELEVTPEGEKYKAPGVSSEPPKASKPPKVKSRSGSDIPKKEKKQDKKDKKDKKPAKKKGKVYTQAELEGMKMGKLRKIGKPLGAKDTKKSELIAEILKAQKKG